MKKHKRSLSIVQKKRPAQKPTYSPPNQRTLTREFIAEHNHAPENVVAAQSVIGNQAVMRLVAEQPMLRWGSRGDSVITLQHLLNQQMGAGLAEDGIFGSLTYKAVMSFQKNAGLAVDGIVGPNTWGSLNKGGNDSPPQPAPPDTENDTGQQLVASMQSIKSLMEGFALSSEGASIPDSALGNANDPALGDAVNVVMPFVGDALQQHQDNVSNEPAAQTNTANFTSQGATAEKSAADPKVAIPELHKEIKEMIKKLPANLQAGFGVLLQQMAAVAAQIKQGKSPTPAMVTTFNKATADLLTKANNINVPATANGSKTDIDIKKSKPWTIHADDIAGVGQELDIRKSTHGEAAHVQRGTGKIKTHEFNPNGTVKKITISIPITMQLPEWPKAGQVGQKCPCWKQEWDKFSAAIEAHEQQHIAIYKLFFSNLHLRCLNQTEEKAFEIFDETMAAAERAQEQFDDATEHGVIGVPSTAFNAGRSCKGC